MYTITTKTTMATTTMRWSAQRWLVMMTILTGTWTPRAFGQDSVVVIPGDVTIAAMLRTNDKATGQCSSYDVRSLQEMMAVTWFVDSVNKMNYINNVTVGLEIYRTCKLPSMATKGVVSLLNKYSVGNQQLADTTAPLLLGLLGPDRTTEAVAVSRLIGSLPTNQRPVQLSGSATAKQLKDRVLYPNFFRVITSDEIQIQVILKLILQLEWNYVAIVYEDDSYGRSAATELRKLAKNNKVCVPVFASLPPDTGTRDFIDRKEDIAGQLESQENGQVLGLIFLGGQSTVQQFLPALKNARYVQLILSEAVGLQTHPLWASVAVRNVSPGSLLTAPPILHIAEFDPVWNQLWTNLTRFQLQADKIPWLRDYYHQITMCNVGAGEDETDCWKRKASVRNEQTISEGEGHQEKFSLYLGYQVKAAAVMISVLKRVVDDSCGTAGQGLCPAGRKAIADRKPLQDILQQGLFHLHDFVSVSANLANFSVFFDDSGNGKNVINADSNKKLKKDVTTLQLDEEYNVYNLKKSSKESEPRFHKVGTFSSGRLSINKHQTEFYNETGSPLTWDHLPPAQCPKNHNCLKCERDASNDVIFMEGDFYVVAISPVHDKDPNDLLKCSKVKSLVGADLAQAVIFAIQRVNDRNNREFKDLLPGRKVGLIGVSSCGSKLLVKQRLMDLYSGRLRLPDGRNSSVLLPHLIGLIGAYFSANSIAASATLTALNKTFIQVSAASTSTDLKDRTRHPYFMRLVPADDKQARVLLDIVQSLGANYVQVIYDSSTAYATGLFLKLNETATNNHYNICIAKSIPITPHKDISEYKYIVHSLRDKSAAKIVIVLLHATQIDKTMAAILPLMTSEDNFLFLASESWGRRQNLIQGRTLLDGSLVLSQEIAVDKIFEEYFDKLDPINTVNPWLKDFWEGRLNCYLDKSFQRKGKTGPCPNNVAEKYSQDSRIAFHIQAVYALVRGFHNALLQHCGPRATSTCKELTSARLVKAMHEVKLNLYSRLYSSPVFDSNGDGLVGYKVLQITRDKSTASGDVIFRDVGQWSEEGLELQKDKLKTVTSECPNAIECQRCFPPRPRHPNSNGVPAKSRPQRETGFPAKAVAGLGAGLGITIIVLVLVIVCLVKRLHSLSESSGSSAGSGREQTDPRTGRARYVATDATTASPYSTPGELTLNSRYFDPMPPPPPPCMVRQRLGDYLTPASESGATNCFTDATMMSSRSLEFENGLDK